MSSDVNKRLVYFVRVSAVYLLFRAGVYNQWPAERKIKSCLLLWTRQFNTWYAQWRW